VKGTILITYNEGIFFLHIVVGLGGALAALRLGRGALVAYVGVQAVLANMFVVKQTVLFGLQVTCADVFIVTSIFGLNLLQEYFSAALARRSVLINLLISFYFVCMTRLHLAYLPSAFDVTHQHFGAIFVHTPRIVGASLVVSFFVQRLDCWLYGWLKSWWLSRFLGLRNIVSVTVTQAVDTVLFSFIGLYGIVSSLLDVMTMSFAVKMIVIALLGPASALAMRVARGIHHDGI
jgi:uncharacterized integral membrane protein (TIGR00697 family)